MAKEKFDWIVKRKRSEPEVKFETPIWLGNYGNGEYFHFQSERDRKVRAEILRRADENARHVGMDRRAFMASSMGMMTTLSVFNLASGCGNSEGMMSEATMQKFMEANPPMPTTPTMAPVAPTVGMDATDTAAAGARQQPMPTGMPSPGPAAPAAAGGPAPAVPDPMTEPMAPAPVAPPDEGGFIVSPEACKNMEFAQSLLEQEYFILDMQTHHAGEGATVLFSCINNDCTVDAYVRAVFEESETTVAILSGLPGMLRGDDINGAFGVSNETLYTTRDRVNMAAATMRMIAHCQVTPNASPEANAEMMERVYKMHQTKGFKSYPPAEGGWFLTDPNAIRFIEKSIELGEPLICAHKGFPFPGWSTTHADPMPDVGKVAAMFPDVNFVIYHSACELQGTASEVPFDPDNPMYNNPPARGGGTARLAKAVHDAGLKDKNVYAEMGSVWNIMMRNAEAAQNYVGKMLKYVGEERLVWGTESIWLGAPQPQIEAFKMFNISAEFQEKWGYPELTDELRRKIFGVTGAKLYGIDPQACYTAVSNDALAMHRRRMKEEGMSRRFVTIEPLMQHYAQYVANGELRRATGAPDA
ncbi:MAG: amidohydrolase family protein [Myxococcales bacterium]|nr:amidohydrolase family protein [Myxococcales bacterium]MDD9966434.1 amidohydrolase family protein [Myxococcales bacterium]